MSGSLDSLNESLLIFLLLWDHVHIMWPKPVWIKASKFFWPIDFCNGDQVTQWVHSILKFKLMSHKTPIISLQAQQHHTHHFFLYLSQSFSNSIFLFSQFILVCLKLHNYRLSILILIKCNSWSLIWYCAIFTKKYL